MITFKLKEKCDAEYYCLEDYFNRKTSNKYKSKMTSYCALVNIMPWTDASDNSGEYVYIRIVHSPDNEKQINQLYHDVLKVLKDTCDNFKSKVEEKARLIKDYPESVDLRKEFYKKNSDLFFRIF